MTRVKKGMNALKRRHNVLRMTKGYRYGLGTKEKQAKEAIRHAGTHAFEGRKDKKNDFRRLWQVQISSLVKEQGLSYSKFMGSLKKHDILINRKMLAELAENNPETFFKIVEKVK